MLLDRDLYEAGKWWNMPNVELSLDSGEVDALREALTFLDEELDAQLKSCETRQERAIRVKQGRITEILLRLEQLSP